MARSKQAGPEGGIKPPNDILLVKLIDQIGDRRRKILDVGSGAGEIALYLAALGHRNVVGIDKDLDKVRHGNYRARDHDLDNCHFLDFDVHDIRQYFQPGDFSVIVARNILHLLGRGSARRTVHDMQTLTAPGGYNAIGGYLVDAELSPEGTGMFSTQDLVESYSREPAWRILTNEANHHRTRQIGDQSLVFTRRQLIAQYRPETP